MGHAGQAAWCGGRFALAEPPIGQQRRQRGHAQTAGGAAEEGAAREAPESTVVLDKVHSAMLLDSIFPEIFSTGAMSD